MSEKGLELIRSILQDDAMAEEEEALHLLLSEQISENAVSEHDNRLTKGQKAADKLAKFAGSWYFIILFFSILVIWIVLNVVFLKKPFDVYPFILMNLILSCLAAIQAPVIMMSQNRQEEKDRYRAKNDYKVNLKAEIIVEDIHNKLDSLIEMQIEIMNRLDNLEKINNEKEKSSQS
ncbi:DUF1003 domain-containing protein [Parasporobacterium paucivorans]|uniref:Uncharacterized membrane protein n=1 Tax=Parasporobacterium paucivorans DSM 15970 TaxID=1122934 RepID=A0A1M6JXS9_9FIRM|nr:DUF1003 domain-containing protein [Parasporobacterium paucivorans]SHJ51499.1 Uncharacterized membrane protein [Parasporobacterium paucivorans DSM 15970]